MELLRVRTLATTKDTGYIDCAALDKDKFLSTLEDLAFGSDGNALDELSKFLTSCCVFQN